MKCRWNLSLVSALVLLISTEVTLIAGANEVFNVKDYGTVDDGLENVTITGGGIEGKIGLTRDPGPAVCE